MQLDEHDKTRQMGKNLRRRAKAFAQTKEFEAAVRDLTIAAKLEPEEWAKDPVSRCTAIGCSTQPVHRRVIPSSRIHRCMPVISLTPLQSWAALLKQCTDAVTKAKAKEKKTWEGAFAKLGGGGSGSSSSANTSAASAGDAGSSGSAASSAAPSPAPLSRAASGGAGAAASASAGAGAADADRHVHFKSPDQGTLRVTASGRQILATGDQAGDGTPERGEKRTLFAGHTPHPSKSKRGQGASAGGDDDDEDDDGSEDGGFSPEEEDGDGDGSGTAEMEAGWGLGTKLALGLGAAAVVGVGVAAAMRFLRSRK